MPKYLVTFRRYDSLSIEITAKNQDQATEKAEAILDKHKPKLQFDAYGDPEWFDTIELPRTQNHGSKERTK